MTYECMDNLNFTLSPKDCVENPDEYISIAKQRFLEDGWEGDGDVKLMWIPPFILMWIPRFMLKRQKQWETKGVGVWHVKQLNDGISWLLYPPGLFEDDEKSNQKNVKSILKSQTN